ncbi:MAG TPA: TIGR02710 family CRISPR-associated protein [Thermococcus litoralis]|uniref:TIGR02710 family CRISPR-associated protein n=1 Tax=Thermococcus litoralis TaxID=2265 RepID=A0A7C0Y714_THELI|nr:TIGR02710 family CRISPR-associated protein [Thermococcus litoralis]
MKILILTVGGSCEPLVNAIKEHKPDFTYFVCSTGPKGSRIVVDGEGKPCKEWQGANAKVSAKPSIVAQTGISQYKIFEISDPDNLNECLDVIESLNNDIRENFDSPKIIANYTGGTKTMSVALSLYTLIKGDWIKENWSLEFNRGPRTDLIKIKAGDVPSAINIWDTIAKILPEKMIKTFLENHYYAEAAELLKEIIRKPIADVRIKLHNLMLACKGFELWDRFDHEGAYRQLREAEFYDKRKYMNFLAILRQKGDEKEGGKALRMRIEYNKVIDILLNSERRAVQKRYDDSVARLYRALELTAQITLKYKYDIDTSDVDLSKVPHSSKKELESMKDNDNKIKIGLKRAYELLADLNDEVGHMYVERREKILNAIQKRNLSILAHGNTPISEEDFKQVKEVICDFIQEVLNKVLGKHLLKPLQFPGAKLLRYKE